MRTCTALRTRLFTATIAIASVVSMSVIVAPNAGAAAGASTSSLKSTADSYLATVIASTQSALAAPTGLKAVGRTGDSVSLSWGAVAGTAEYRVMVSPNADMSGASYWRFPSTSGTVKLLKPETNYYFKVRSLDADGASLTAYSAAVSAATGVAAPAPPAGLKTVGQTGDSVSLSWGAVAGTAEYRVMVSANADMSGASYWRFPSTSGTVKLLKPDTMYYFKIRSLKSDGSSLTAYSAAVSARTGTATPAAPTGLRMSFQTPTALGLAWEVSPSAERYRIALSPNADMSKAVYYRFTDPTADIRGLTPGTAYYAQVRSITADGANISAYSPIVRIQTTAAPVLGPVVNPLSVASFNIHCANCEDQMETEVPWVDRRDAVVRTIVSKRPDIIGIQEASQGWLVDSPAGGLSQFEDLRNRLSDAGAPYKLTNEMRNNCVDPHTPTDCVPKEQGATKGTRIFYNPNAVRIIRSGSKLLPSLAPEKNQRYLAWAEVEQISTGKHFFFGDTHLEVDKAEGYNELRRQQAQTIVNVIKAENTTKLPVLMVGDLNSSKWLDPSNAAYDVFIAAGLVDPLGNTYGSTLPSGYATAEKATNRHINSWNGFERLARASAPGTNGTYIDYIFTSKMRVPTWETVASVDSTGNYVGQIPSDHNMVYATVGLP
ncbi:fibronectin type III domain-containing protein [Pseudarthrobacter sp. S9]|uniref:fibronectin type III domain-containing protein n=1 Tax=Pseudarthrobacter sp. S9 TaxID=3418421 RepID=UPI003CFFEE4E